jgi:hypothetical protein
VNGTRAIKCTTYSSVFDQLVVQCPSACPKTPPVDGGVCDIDSRFQCVYGDAITCDGDPAYTFQHEMECVCLDGNFNCNVNKCSTQCPESLPSEGEVCIGQFKPGVLFDLGCNYGELCCPDDEGGTCVPDQNCFCEFSSSISCQDAASYASLPCRSVCPETPPKTDDVCDIDPRYECRYGVPLPCKVGAFGYSVYTRQCSCSINGTYDCESNFCPPVACPDLQPAHGDTCSPFVGGSCNYTKQPCCVQGGAVPCVANSTCSCDETDYTTKCSELPMVFCPPQVNGNNTASGGNNGKMNSKNKKGRSRRTT